MDWRERLARAKEEKRPRPERGRSLYQRLDRKGWVAYLRACESHRQGEPEDMAPQGMVPFGSYPAHKRTPKRDNDAFWGRTTLTYDPDSSEWPG